MPDMIKQVTYKGKDYIIIYADFTVDDVTSPVMIQVNIDHIDKKHRHILFNKMSDVLDKHFKFKIVKPEPKVKSDKPWYRFW
jgi:hypothetical protein